MKNLKKVLALVLAFACAFTMFAGAAFTDEADINADNRDAVELLTALNIIQGYEDGSFDPEGTVTRAEMAKMIYTIRNGGNDDASAYETVTTTFQDINGHWAEGYIKYLQNTGIVAGNSPTEFDPDSQVTTGEAMKMALVLSGYDATNAELTGISWLNNTVSLATTVGLTKDVASAIASGCTRQDAAQILSNTLTEVYAVRWSAIVEDFVPDSKSGLAYAGNMITVGEKWMDLAVATGYITKGPSSKTNPKGITFVSEDGYAEGHTLTFRDTTIDVTDLAGFEVKVVWDSEHQNAVDGVYGVYKTDNNTSWEAMWKDIEDGANNTLKFDGQSVDVSTLNVYANGYDTNYSLVLSNFAKDNVADLVTLIDKDGDGEVDTLQYKTQNVAKVTYVDSNKLNTTSLIGSTNATPVDWFHASEEGYTTNPDLDDVITYDGIAKDDYVKVTYDYYNNKVAYEKIDEVEATVEATRTNQGTLEIRIDGNWYKAAEGYSLPSLVSGDSISYVAIDNLLYNVDKTDGTWGSKNLAMIYNASTYDVGVNKDKLEIALIDRNGDKITGILDEYNNIEVGDDSTAYKIDTDFDGTAESVPIADVMNKIGNQLVTYRQNGSNISLMPVGADDFDTNADGTYDFKFRQLAGYDDIYDTTRASNALTNDDLKAAAWVDSTVNTAKGGFTSNGTFSIADDAVVFAYNGTEAVVTNGRVLKANDSDVTAIAKYALGNTTNGVNYIQAMVVAMNPLPTATGNNYAYVLSAAEETINGVEYRHFELWTENGPLDAYEESADTYTYKGGEIVTYDVVSTGDRTIIKSVERVAAGDTMVGYITSDGFYNNGNSISINGYAYDLASDCTVVNVNTDNKSGIEGNAIDMAFVASKDNAGNWINNVVYVKDGNDLVFVMVDTYNNEIIDEDGLY